MDDRRFERLESIMERGFATLADLQRETNARLDETNARLGRVETNAEVLTTRVGVIEHVLVDLASQLVDQGRLLRGIADRHDGAIDEIKRRLDAVERRLPPEKH
jgi:hypothetical protein